MLFFSSVLEDCMKSKNTSCYFQHKFSTKSTRRKFTEDMQFIFNFQCVSEIFNTAPSSVDTCAILDSKLG